MTLTAFEAKTIGGSLCGISALHIDKDGSRHHFHSPIDVGAQPKKDPITLIGRIEGAPALRDIWPEIRSWFTGSLVLFCGSDLNALVKALEAEGLYVPTLFYINLKEMARGARPDLFPDAKSISLPKLCLAFGAEEGDAPESCVRVFEKLFPACRDWETYIGMLKAEKSGSDLIPESYTFFDCETADATGQICAIGILHLDGKGELTEYYTLIDPERPIHKDNYNIHHISDEMVKGAPTFPEAWREIEKWFDGSVLVAHAAVSADLYFLRATAAHYGIPLRPAHYLCSCTLAKKYLPDSPNHRLDTLCERYGIPLEHHNAMSDTYGCYKLFLEMQKLAGGEKKLAKQIGVYDFAEKQRDFVRRRMR